MEGGRYRLEPLGQHHRRAAFLCGVDELDRYLREQAGQAVRRKLAAVFVLNDVEAQAIVGYYTLSALQIEPVGLPEHLAKKWPRHPIPATLLGRLAVDRRYQGQGFGDLLLHDALNRALKQSEQVGSMAVVVDVKEEGVRPFYERVGFQRFAASGSRLFIPMATIERL